MLQRNLDSLILYYGKIVPIEVKAGENLQEKSLKLFSEKYKSKYAIKTSMSDCRKEEWMINLPLYGINELVGMVEK